ILWGIIHRSNIDYAERIWEEFVQSIQTFLTDKKNLTMMARGKKKSVGKDGREIFGMLIPDALLTDEIKRAPYYGEYLEHAAKVTKPTDEKAPNQTSSQPPKSTLAPIEPSKKDQGKKRKPVKETSDAPSSAKHSKAGKGQARPVVFREPESGRFQLLPEVQENGKEKVIKEQVAHDLLTLETLKRKSPSEQFIFQRRTPMPTEPSGIADSPSLDVDLAPTDSEIESDEEVPGINAEDQDKGQVGPNPGVQAVESQPQSGHVVHAGPNLEHTD
ncbi:hypothetical protein Tco_1581292, partial [Tanacetum coccineum]